MFNFFKLNYMDMDMDMDIFVPDKLPVYQQYICLFGLIMFL